MKAAVRVFTESFAKQLGKSAAQAAVGDCQEFRV